MGVSTDAYLFYGLCSDEEGIPEWLTDGDVREDVDDTLKKFGCVLDFHCQDECPMVLLAAGERTYDNDKPSAFYRAARGCPIMIGDKLPDTTGWAERITKAADASGWPKDQRNIGWLASNWA